MTSMNPSHHHSERRTPCALTGRAKNPTEYDFKSAILSTAQRLEEGEKLHALQDFYEESRMNSTHATANSRRAVGWRRSSSPPCLRRPSSRRRISSRRVSRDFRAWRVVEACQTLGVMKGIPSTVSDDVGIRVSPDEARVVAEARFSGGLQLASENICEAPAVLSARAGRRRRNQ